MFHMTRSNVSFGLILTTVLTLSPALGVAEPAVRVDSFKGNAVSVIEANTGAVLATITLSRDGKTGYVTNDGGKCGSVVELRAGKPATIAVGNSPYTLLVQPPVKITRATSPSDDSWTYMN
jgi:hypothetical protein